MYLSRLLNVFVQILKCICTDFKMYLYRFQNVFVQISKCVCAKLKQKVQNYVFKCTETEKLGKQNQSGTNFT